MPPQLLVLRKTKCTLGELLVLQQLTCHLKTIVTYISNFCDIEVPCTWSSHNPYNIFSSLEQMSEGGISVFFITCLLIAEVLHVYSLSKAAQLH
jgi:hypothetical protein